MPLASYWIEPRPGAPPLVILHAIFTAVADICRDVTSSILLLVTMLLAAVAVMAVVGFFGFGLTGVVSLRLARRRAARRE